MKHARREKGLTTLEYAIAGGLISATLVGIFPLIGDAVLERLRVLLAALVAAG